MTALPADLLDTTRMPPADRWPFFVDIAERAAARVALASDHVADFRATSRVIDLGTVQLTRFRYQSLTGWRTPRLIRQADPEIFQVAMVTSGASEINTRLRSTTMARSDFTLLDWSRPHRIEHRSVLGGRELASSVTATVPRALLPISPERVERATAALMSGIEGPGALLAQHLNHLTRHPEQFRVADAPRLADLTLSLIAALLAHHLDIEDDLPAEIRQRATLTQITAFIDRHLDDHALTPCAVAEAHRLSLRTLHRLFEDEPEGVAGRIRRRRLDRCRADLVDPALRHVPVRQVGRRWGLTDPAHFSRAFRAAYGVSPRAYREVHLPPPDGRSDRTPD